MDGPLVTRLRLGRVAGGSSRDIGNLPPCIRRCAASNRVAACLPQPGDAAFYVCVLVFCGGGGYAVAGGDDVVAFGQRCDPRDHFRPTSGAATSSALISWSQIAISAVWSNVICAGWSVSQAPLGSWIAIR